MRLMKNWLKISLIMIAVGAALFALSFTLGARGGYAYFGNGGLRIVPTGDAILVQEMDLLAFDTVQITTRLSNIEFIESDRYGLEIRLPPYADQPNWDITNGKLTVEIPTVRNTFTIMNLDVQSYYVKIFFPGRAAQEGSGILDTIFRSVDLSTTSGDIRIAALMSDNLILKTASGSINVNLQHYKQAVAKTTSGDITFLGSGDNASLVLDVSSGNITADASGCVDVDIKTTSGSIKLIGDTLANALLKTATGSGNIIVNVSAWQSLTAETRNGDVRITGEPYGATNVDARSGSVTVILRGDERDFSYEISTRSGSIHFGGIRMGNIARNVSNYSEKSINIETSSGNVRVDFNN